MTDLETLAAELEAAKQDLALFQRLTSAEQRVEQLTVEYDKAQAVNERAEANEAKAAHASAMAGGRFHYWESAVFGVKSVPSTRA